MKNNSIKKSAQRIRKKGEGNDSVLAHINPAEAMLLANHFGGDINPDTGLPQFGGFFRGITKSVGKLIGAPLKVVGKISKPIQKALPFAGTLIGGMMGGPAGAIAGGSLGGGLSSKNHILDHALGGALAGLGHSFISPAIGSKLGLNPDSFFGKVSMMNSPSLGQTLGIGGMGENAFRATALKNLAKSHGKSGYSAGEERGESNGLLGNMGLLDTALLATGALGILKGKQKYPKYGTPENESMQQRINDNKHDWGPMEKYFPKVKERNPIKYPPPGYRGTSWNYFPSYEEQQEQMMRVNQEMNQPDYAPNYAKGGKVEGYYKGKEGGQSDKRFVKLKPDSFIVNATTVSLAGDGNSDNGAHIIKDWAKSFMKGDYVRDEERENMVKAYVSDGELELEPKEVLAIGNGSIDRGVKTLRKMEKNMRKHKGVKKFLPPKSKDLDSYAGIKR